MPGLYPSAGGLCEERLIRHRRRGVDEHHVCLTAAQQALEPPGEREADETAADNDDARRECGCLRR
jgi:hypothetical protein